MKTILFLLLSTSLFAQEKVWTHGLIMQSDWYAKESPGTFCYFTAMLGDQYVDLKIKIVSEEIISPIFITTFRGKFTLPRIKLTDRGFSVYRLFLRNKSQWVSIDSDIKYIEAYNGSKWIKINIYDNLTKLKNFTYGN